MPCLLKDLTFWSDPKTAECNSLKGEDKFKTDIYSSELISLEDARKCYKRFENATLNDYLLGMFSIGIKKWLSKNGVKDPSKILTLIPVNLRPLPTNIHELKIGNYVHGSRNEIYLEDNLNEAIKSAQKSFKSKITSRRLDSIDIFYSFLLYLPDFIKNKFFPNIMNGVHLLFSNIQGSDSIWKIWGKEVLEFELHPNLTSSWNLNIMCTTYNKKMRLILLANSELKMDPKQLMDIVNEDIKNDIKSWVNT